MIAYLNINSYRYKYCDILELLHHQYVDIMCVAETKLDQTYPDGQFIAENYVMYRRDGISSRSGGLITYVSTAISSRRRSDLEPVNNECITIEYTQDRKKSIVFVCYRSPSTNVKMYLEALTKCMDKALCETETIIIIGDLNQNMLQRTTSNEIRDFADMFALKNFIKSATCYKNPENHTLVDLLLCNKSRQFSSAGVIENGLSDVHHFIFGVLSHQYIPNKPKTITYQSYKSCDENDFNKDLSETPFYVGAVFDDVEDKMVLSKITHRRCQYPCPH